MSYISITQGCNIADIAKNEAGEVSGATYNYYLMTRNGGTGVIMREKTDGLEYRFFLFNGDVDTVWTNRTSHTYIRSSAVKDI